MDKRIEGTFENADLVIEAIHQLRNEEGFSPSQLLVVTRNKEPDTITEQTEVEVVITSEDPEGSLWHKIKNFFTVSLDGEEEEEELLESYGIEEETYERFEDALEKGEYLLLVDDAAPNHPEHAGFLVRDGILDEEDEGSGGDMAPPQTIGSLSGTRALTDEEQLSPGEAADIYLDGPDTAVTTAGGTPEKDDQPLSALGAEGALEDTAAPQTIGSLSGTRALTDEEQLSPGEAVDIYLDGPDTAVTTAGGTADKDDQRVSALGAEGALEDTAAPQTIGSLSGTRALTDEEQLSPGEAVDIYLDGPDTAVTTAGGTPEKDDQLFSALGAEGALGDTAAPQTISSLSGTRALTDEEQLSPGEAVDIYLDGPDTAVTTAGGTAETETRTVSSLIEEEDGTTGDISTASLEAEKKSGTVERIVPSQTTIVHQNIQGKEELDMSEENKKDFPASKEEALKAANQGAHPDPEPAQAQQEDYSGKEIPSSQDPDPIQNSSEQKGSSSEEEGESSDEEGDRRLSQAPDVAEDTTGEPIQTVEPGGDPTMASANQKMPGLLYDAEESQPQLQQQDTKVSHDPFGMETQEIAPEEDGRQVEPDYDENKNDFGQK